MASWWRRVLSRFLGTGGEGGERIGPAGRPAESGEEQRGRPGRLSPGAIGRDGAGVGDSGRAVGYSLKDWEDGGTVQRLIREKYPELLLRRDELLDLVVRGLKK